MSASSDDNGIDWLQQAVPQSECLSPYVPGKPVAQLLRERGLTDEIPPHVIKLASNENPFGPPPAAMAAIRDAASEVHRYPDGNATALKAVLASHHGVNADQILLGNGSNEVLELLIRSFAGVGDAVIYSQRGFMVYALATIAAGADGVAVPETDGLSHDLDGMAAAVNAQSNVICIANPNNPTGTMHTLVELQRFLDRLPRHLVVIIDEAYGDFVAEELGESIGVLHHPGLVITRTFSKAYGLAGLRVGYAVADAALLAVVNRFREPFNLNLIAQAAAIAALSDRDWVLARAADVVAEQKRLESALAGMGLLLAPCHGNFILIHHPQAAELVSELEGQGMILRSLAPYGMWDAVRITVGLPEENDRLLVLLAGWAE
ncbi:MAG: histidinol-phosphate transaminase [Mariprofundales bacterium]|nr:histidinol-phosphate transaminase [Mariprofundales bacterium]